MTSLDFSGDYKQRLNEWIDRLDEEKHEIPRDERMEIIQRLTDEYVEQTGERPDPVALLRLTDITLHEELSDPHPDKMTREEAPILSDRMAAVRTSGKERKKNKTGVVLTEVPLEHGSNVATDGTNHTLPVRSFNNSW